MSTVAEKTAARSPGPLYHVSVHTFHIFILALSPLSSPLAAAINHHETDMRLWVW